MLEQISWSEYWTMVATTTAVYYAGIGVLFYRKKIIAAFNRTPQQNKADTSDNAQLNVMGSILSEPTIADTQSSDKEIVEDEKEEVAMEETPENIRTLDKTTQTGDLINEALSGLGVNTNSQELITTLSAIIQNQNSDGSLRPFRNTLDWHIHQSALDSCGISLEKEDLDAIWKEAESN
ncbi:hypothetical protein [Rhizosphaericola mali]|uniref:Uncharacterized protein n=1 Tax=Rhizosphaericola mali TaxID=2545455 RepID=A0A5P2G2H3_9BACT|nr:hypothetical protein [Rhizosphaericola mali]QES88918.1 hypothetical protein E0W69_009695 [Rhizosphaericola mali]